MPNPVTADEREKIVMLLKEHGGNRNKVARECGRSPSTVQGIAEAHNIPPNIRAPKNANQARRDYAQAERLELLNEGFDKARDVLKGIGLADDLKDWSVAVGTLIDKRRLEDGEATSRSESVDPARRQKMKESLDEVAAQRRKSVG